MAVAASIKRAKPCYTKVSCPQRFHNNLLKIHIHHTGIADTITGIADTITGIADTITGIADTITDIADTITDILHRSTWNQCNITTSITLQFNTTFQQPLRDDPSRTNFPPFLKRRMIFSTPGIDNPTLSAISPCRK